MPENAQPFRYEKTYVMNLRLKLTIDSTGPLDTVPRSHVAAMAVTVLKEMAGDEIKVGGVGEASVKAVEVVIDAAPTRLEEFEEACKAQFDKVFGSMDELYLRLHALELALPPASGR